MTGKQSVVFAAVAVFNPSIRDVPLDHAGAQARRSEGSWEADLMSRMADRAVESRSQRLDHPEIHRGQLPERTRVRAVECMMSRSRVPTRTIGDIARLVCTVGIG